MPLQMVTAAQGQSIGRAAPAYPDIHAAAVPI
jgi:hypothetical protein